MAAETTQVRTMPSVSGALRTMAGATFAGSLGVIAAVVLWIWRDFYMLDKAAQAEHPMHDMVGAGGFVGLWLGVLGTGLLLGMLSYSVRKKLTSATWLGPVSNWLIFHIICGVMGPILIILHSGMRLPTGLIAMGFWFMIAVAFSGVFGRYIYGFFPRTAAGLELDLGEAAKNLSTLRSQLVEQTQGADSEQIAQAVLLARDVNLSVNSLPQLVRFQFEVRRRSRVIRLIMADAGLPKDARKLATRTLLAQLQLRKSQETWAMSKRIFRYWHLFHLPLAKVMYLIIVLHVIFALLFSGGLQTLAHPPF